VGFISNFVLAAYSLSIVVIFVFFLRARSGQHQERYLDYRALAEALRVAVYWKLLGIGSGYIDAKTAPRHHHAVVKVTPLGIIADAYPIKQPNELAWVKICLRTLERLDKPQLSAADPKFDPTGHAIARRFWVRGQYQYFKRQQLREESLADLLETVSATLLAISPFVLAPLLIFGLLPHWGALDLEHVAIIVIGVLPGIAAALTGYCERLAYKAKARHYDRMRVLFERACLLLPERIDEKSAPLAAALYGELGTEAMKENAEWVAIYRQRPIQPLQ
jgi:hypothetical protein